MHFKSYCICTAISVISIEFFAHVFQGDQYEQKIGKVVFLSFRKIDKIILFELEILILSEKIFYISVYRYFL